jgi:AraC-like DNA-binding protein
MPFPIRYAQDRISVDFPASWATRRSDRYDPGLWQVVEARCLAQEEEVALTNAIGSIQAQIVHLYEKSGRMPLIKELAEYRKQSPRTLMRYLKSRGMQYKTLTDSIQKRFAMELLESGQLSVEKVASTLGFSDSSSFRRSFRRWTGANPSEWTRSASKSADIDAGDTGDLSSQPVAAEAAQTHGLA